MQAITLNQAQRDLPELIAQVLADAEPTIICTESGEHVVCVSLDEFNSWQESIYLLSNPANAQRLRASIGQVGCDTTQPRDLIQP
jgi:antitoxin YefM